MSAALLQAIVPAPLDVPNQWPSLPVLEPSGIATAAMTRYYTRNVGKVRNEDIFYAQVFNRNSSSTGLADTAVVIDIRAEVCLAGDSEALVNRIADRLLGGQISASLKADAKAAAERYAATSPTHARPRRYT